MLLGKILATALFGMVITAGLAFAPSAYADSRSNTVGDNSGTPFVASCKPGEALVGVVYNSAEQMYAIGALCRPIADGAFTGPLEQPAHIFGLQGGDGNDPSVCPEGHAVHQVSVYLTTNNRVHHLRFICRNIVGDHTADVYMKATTASGPVGSTGIAKCTGIAVGEYATGIVGTYGGGVTSLGLQCHNLEDNSSDTGDNTTTNTDTADNPPADTDTDTDNGNGDDGNNNTITIQVTPPDQLLPPKTLKPGPSGGVRTVKVATTLYAKPAGKELAYLNPGDKVSVVACENGGRGWCQVSKPAKGFVWGDDLGK